MFSLVGTIYKGPMVVQTLMGDVFHIAYFGIDAEFFLKLECE